MPSGAVDAITLTVASSVPAPSRAWTAFRTRLASARDNCSESAMTESPFASVATRTGREARAAT